MFEIKVNAEFEAAHRIAGYPGKCDRLHGHSWTVEISAVGNELDELGMLVDFKKVKQAAMEILDRMDHQYLNELPAFQSLNPTAENIAKYLYEALEQHEVFSGKAGLKAVRVWESPKSSVIYSKEA